MGQVGLEGLRILIVEDDAVIAFDLEDVLREAGAVPVGPALTLAAGRALAEAGTIDAAVLDIDLGCEKVWPLAEYLHEHGTPFALVSAQCAYSAPPFDTTGARCTIAGMPGTFGNPPCVGKPARRHAIVELLAGLVTRRSTPPAPFAAN